MQKDAEGYAVGMEMESRQIGYRWLGLVSYDAAHALQRRLVDERVNESGTDTFLAMEHEPVLTLGKNASIAHLHLSEAQYTTRGIALRRVERGGEVTYHGPGHLVAYPIINLRAAGISLRQHICALEDALIAACAHYGIAAERRDGAPGCWVADRKIGAVGVRVERGVAWHGLALNVGRNLETFSLINPCGHAGGGLDVAFTGARLGGGGDRRSCSSRRRCAEGGGGCSSCCTGLCGGDRRVSRGGYDCADERYQRTGGLSA